MKLIYKNPGYKYLAESLSEFIKQDEFWNGSIFHFFPKLSKLKWQYNKDDNKNIVKKILGTVIELYESREKEIRHNVIS